jgi:hypothetical protein
MRPRLLDLRHLSTGQNREKPKRHSQVQIAAIFSRGPRNKFRADKVSVDPRQFAAAVG